MAESRLKCDVERDLVVEGDVQARRSILQIRGRIHPGKRAKVVVEMRLVEVAAR